MILFRLHRFTLMQFNSRCDCPLPPRSLSSQAETTLAGFQVTYVKPLMFRLTIRSKITIRRRAHTIERRWASFIHKQGHCPVSAAEAAVCWSLSNRTKTYSIGPNA